MSDQQSEQRLATTCSEELHFTMLLLQEVRDEICDILASIETGIADIKQSGHLPSAALLERLGHKMEARRDQLEG